MLIMLLASFFYDAGAQYTAKEGSVWAFGFHVGIDFSSGRPEAIYTASHAREGGASVADWQGNLLFYTDGARLWDSTHNLMGNLSLYIPGPAPYVTGLSMTTITTFQAATIVPDPADFNKYYVFSLEATSRDGTMLEAPWLFGVGNPQRPPYLYYSVVDMRLNGGLGGIVPGYNSIPLDSFLTEKMTVVPGDDCNAWLLVRGQNTNEYRAYEITGGGIRPPVISAVGLFAGQSVYGKGALKTSPDRRRVAAVCTYVDGLELYDFDPATGILSNPVIINDTNNNEGLDYRSVSFSPNSSKIYLAGTSKFGKPEDGLYQFDLSLSGASAIRASKTRVWKTTHNWTSTSNTHSDTDLKIGPDGKIYYVGEGPYHISFRLFMHVINQPDQPGTACDVINNGVALYPYPESGKWKGLPNEIAMPVPDTFYARRDVVICFRDSAYIEADTGGRQFIWDDGSMQANRMVHEDGRYTVGYFHGITRCVYHVDTFVVSFSKRIPQVLTNGYSCPGAGQGIARVRTQRYDTVTYTYTWTDSAGNILHTYTGNGEDTVRGLNPGTYGIRITTPKGCDTVLYTTIESLPVPQAGFTSDTLMCPGDTVFFENTSGEYPIWQWHFGDGATASGWHAAHVYPDEGLYPAQLTVENIERCKDTFTRLIEVRGLKLELTAVREIVDRGTSVTLYTNAGEAYSVLAWLPEVRFPDPSSVSQVVYADSTDTYFAVAISDHGCIDTAAVTIAVHPELFFPTAFTPNGDGKNDFFRPAKWGGNIRVRSLVVFDRWGKSVWTANGNHAITGWDGNQNGMPAQAGVYFYIAETETDTGKVIFSKGEVTLLR